MYRTKEISTADRRIGCCAPRLAALASSLSPHAQARLVQEVRSNLHGLVQEWRELQQELQDEGPAEGVPHPLLGLDTGGTEVSWKRTNR